MSPSTHEIHPQLARLKAELEKERGERTRIEQRCASLNSQVKSLHLQLSENLNAEQESSSRLANLEGELRENRDSFAQAKADAEAARQDRQSLEEHLALTKELNLHLEQNLALSDGRAKSFETSQKELHEQIERAQARLRETETALDREREARQQAEMTLEAALRDQRAFEQSTVVELSRLRSAYDASELERARSHEYVLSSRAEAIESTRNARALVGGLRKNLARVLEHINGTTAELLRSPLSDEQKFVLESLVGDIIELEGALEKTEPAAEETAPRE
jgi:chromosome segregation ATPase